MRRSLLEIFDLVASMALGLLAEMISLPVSFTSSLVMALEDELEDGVELNRSGNIDDNYNNWSRGEDFFEGRDTQHKLVYKNLVYEQYKWDGRNLFYYVNKDGELVLKVNEAQTYTGYVEPYSS